MDESSPRVFCQFCHLEVTPGTEDKKYVSCHQRCIEIISKDIYEQIKDHREFDDSKGVAGAYNVSDIKTGASKSAPLRKRWRLGVLTEKVPFKYFLEDLRGTEEPIDCGEDAMICEQKRDKLNGIREEEKSPFVPSPERRK